MSDHKDNTTNERPGMLTDSGAQNMPPANVFADMFKAALAPVLSQLTTLNENVSAVLLNEHEDSEEDGETASNDRPAMSADMDADLSALLVSAGKDDNTEAMPGEDLLKEREDPSFADSYRPLRPFAKVWRLFLIICCQKRWGTRSSRPNWTNILVQRMSRVCEPRK